MIPPPPFVHPDVGPAGLARLGRALELWQACGARLVALPWTAPAACVQATRPPTATGRDVDTPHGHLLASGEQAFCWLALAGLLDAPGFYVGFSPCFRDEAVFGAHHHYGFLKAEVFAWPDPQGPAEARQVHLLAQCAAAVMGRLAGATPELVALPDGTWDLELAGLEVGSIGARTLPGPGPARRYFYATALAEPRFSQALVRLRTGRYHGMIPPPGTG